MPWPNSSITLYHGTTDAAARDIQKNGVDTSLLGYSTDFGAGLYTTTRRKPAEDWARRRAGSSASPALVVWETTFEDLGRLHVCAFGDGGPSAIDFWEYIRFNRTKRAPHLTNSWFDLSVGPMATPYIGQSVHSSHGPSPFRFDGRFWIQRLDIDQYCFHMDRGIAFLDALPKRVEVVTRTP